MAMRCAECTCENGGVDCNWIGQPNWYKNRHELAPNMVFEDFEGDLVLLVRRVPGDGTTWYAACMCGDHWCYDDYTIEPGDLKMYRWTVDL